MPIVLNSPPNPAGADQREKFLLFNVGKLNLALPIAQVVKILNYQVSHGSGSTATGLVHLEGRSVTVLDLHQQFFKTPAAAPVSAKPFLILVKNSAQEEFCLLVNTTPTLVEVRRSDIRLLPDSYRRHDTLASAAQVMIVQEKGQNFTVFILDPDQLLSAQRSG
ncbi:MAG: chemotaxis protein CheW [Cyanobacteriota bacterium]|jgi:chemotaxis signal transduction protein